jgi:hypothetical protein
MAMTSINILIYSDSTALPRPNSVVLDQTWPHVLRRLLEGKLINTSVELINRSFGGINIKKTYLNILHDVQYFGRPTKDLTGTKSIIILAIGIVDASPQPITYKLKKISIIPKIGPRIWGKLKIVLSKKRPQIQKIWSYNTTKKKVFLKYLQKINYQLSKFNFDLIVYAETPNTHTNLEKRSPGISTSIDNYNSIKLENIEGQKNFVYLGFEQFNDNFFENETDGHHFSRLGHAKFAEKLNATILDMLASD